MAPPQVHSYVECKGYSCAWALVREGLLHVHPERMFPMRGACTGKCQAAGLDTIAKESLLQLDDIVPCYW